ncbi:MAG: HAMP domain-containing sensor histidine kinase [Phototrophicaceae bacterium]
MMVQTDNQLEQLQQQVIEEQRMRAERELELQQMYAFLSHAAHDLKTPITTLKTSLYLLQRKPQLATPERLSMMEGQLDRLANLIDAMSLMARLDDQSELDMNETNLGVVIDEAVWSITDRAKAKSITIQQDLLANIPVLSLNFEESKRALVNLLDNAITYSDPNSAVTIRVFEMHGYLCVDIVDEGTGLSDEEIARLFERFYRGDDAGHGDDQGAGMGLPITKRIAELHGGKMRVITEKGQGSTFRIMLPIITETPS